MKKILLLLLTISCHLFTSEKVLIISDTWHAIGGAEEVLDQVTSRMEKQGYIVKHLTLDDVPLCPWFKEWKVANPIGLSKRIGDEIQAFKPDRILIVYLGVMSHMAGTYCHKNKIRFAAFFPSKIPEICKQHYHLPFWLSNYFIRNFFTKASHVLLPSKSLGDDLADVNIGNFIVWPHGVDTNRFHIYSPSEKEAFVEKFLKDKKRPFYLYVGRLSKAKNIQAFLDLPLEGTKILVGPDCTGFTNEDLRQRYPDIVFPGPQRENLVGYFASSDVFVFPSKTDTFGLVQLEALACGLPVVAFNVTGPKDVVPPGCGVSYLAQNNEELYQYAMKAWEDRQNGRLTPDQCRAYAMTFSWDAATEKLLKYLPLIHWDGPK